MLKTLTWYEQQDFAYFYYKSFVHAWDVGGQHAASYYLPAIAWAAKLTGDKRWRDHLAAKLALFADPQFQIYRWGQGSFCWGSDLPILKELIGAEQFAKTFTTSMLAGAFEHCLEDLKKYREPGGTCSTPGAVDRRPAERLISPHSARQLGSGMVRP